MYLVYNNYSIEAVALSSTCAMLVLGFLVFEIWAFVGISSDDSQVSCRADSSANACSCGGNSVVVKNAADEKECTCLAVERRALIVPAGAPAKPIKMASSAPFSAVCAVSVSPAVCPAVPPASAASAAACTSSVPAACSTVSPPAASPSSVSSARAPASDAAADYLVSLLPLLVIYLVGSRIYTAAALVHAPSLAAIFDGCSSHFTAAGFCLSSAFGTSGSPAAVVAIRVPAALGICAIQCAPTNPAFLVVCAAILACPNYGAAPASPALKYLNRVLPNRGIIYEYSCLTK
ncbi:hypothetical protein [Parasitella parasitica]|uniref:Uncharacterized protein n=1 Tax=Parasitella parasitica TaxID=35722 RepID=A0A0B7N6Q8_9FUNG|nr:hypothetical protein [Parasitella parasitica]